jgi:hypothetical protein
MATARGSDPDERVNSSDAESDISFVLVLDLDGIRQNYHANAVSNTLW